MSTTRLTTLPRSTLPSSVSTLPPLPPRPHFSCAICKLPFPKYLDCFNHLKDNHTHSPLLNAILRQSKKIKSERENREEPEVRKAPRLETNLTVYDLRPTVIIPLSGSLRNIENAPSDNLLKTEKRKNSEELLTCRLCFMKDEKEKMIGHLAEHVKKESEKIQISTRNIEIAQEMIHDLV